MTADLRVVAASMRSEGKTLAQIAEVVGRSKPTICRWLDPEREERSREQSRAWKAANAERRRDYDHAYHARVRDEGRWGRCACGNGLSDHNESKTCDECQRRESAATMTKAVAAWIEGARYPEMRAILGVNHNGAVSITFARLRAAGYDVPRRKPGGAVPPIWVDPLPSEPIVVHPGWAGDGNRALQERWAA